MKCLHCGEPITSSSADPNMPYVHTKSHNCYCDVDVPEDAVWFAGKYGQRFDDPTTGTFTSPDTITRLADPGNGNLYAYAADNPTNNIDPTGRGILGDVLEGISTFEDVATPIALGGAAIGAGIEIGGVAAIGLGLLGGVPLILAGVAIAGIEAYNYYES